MIRFRFIGVSGFVSSLVKIVRVQINMTFLALVLCAAAVVVVTVRSIVFYMFCVLNSKKVYDKLFLSVRDTFIRFFELNPIGS